MRYAVRGTRYAVRGMRYAVRGTRYAVRGRRYAAQGEGQEPGNSEPPAPCPLPPASDLLLHQIYQLHPAFNVRLDVYMVRVVLHCLETYE